MLERILALALGVILMFGVYEAGRGEWRRFWEEVLRADEGRSLDYRLWQIRNGADTAIFYSLCALIVVTLWPIAWVYWVYIELRASQKVIARATLFVTAALVGLATRLADSVTQWWRSVYLSPPTAVARFSERTIDTETLGFLCEFDFLVGRLVLWFVLAAIAAILRQLGAERREFKKVYVCWASMEDARAYDSCWREGRT